MSFKVTRSDPKGSVTNTEVSGKVSAVEGSFTTSNIEPSGSVTYVDINAATSYIRSVFTVSYSSIFAADIQLGLFIIRKTLEDAGLFTDYIDSVAFGKSLYDEVAAVEDLIRATIKKVADDPVSVADLPSLGFSTSFINGSSVSDSSFLSPNKNLDEVANTSDQQYLGVGKDNTDSVVFATDLAYAFNRSKLDEVRFYDGVRLRPDKHNIDYAELYDENTISFGKSHTDLVALSDTNLFFGLDYFLTDQIGATDDFYGAANIDDDQTMQFSKLTTDVAYVSESFSRDVQFDRRFFNTASSSDYLYFQNTKSLSDSARFSDLLVSVMHFVRLLDDTAFAYDAIDRKSFTKSAQDSASIVDLFSRDVSFSRAFGDSSSFTDAITLLTGVSLTNTAATSDILSKVVQYDRAYSNAVGVEVSISNEAHKYLADNSAASDSDVKSIGKVNSDLVEITDTGSLFWQDYTVDMTYFAQDYVGDRQLF